MKVTIDVTPEEQGDKTQLARAAEEEIAAFERYFTEKVDPSGGPRLMGPERAILKTYLWWRTVVAPQGGTPLG